MISSVLYDALIATVYWMPFVLAIGVVYSYMRVIDISVDGVVVIAGIAVVVIWNYTNNFWVGLIAGMLIGGIGSGLFAVLVHLFGINNLIAGIVFSLFCYSLSTVLIGESVTVSGSAYSFSELDLIEVLSVDVLLLVIVHWFYNTRIGTLIRGISDQADLRVFVNKNIVYILGHFLTGMILGLGAAFYVRWEGLARAGGGFDFLVTGLTSYLVSERAFAAISAAVSVNNNRIEKLFSSLVVKVIFGTILFQFLIYAIIYYSPVPQIWKLILSLFLAISLLDFSINNYQKRRKIDKSIKQNNFSDCLKCENIEKVFHENNEMFVLFKESSISFCRGLNVVVGENGAGKSTLIRCINGDESLTGGSIYINSLRVDNVYKDERPFFILRQNSHYNLAGSLFVYENIDIIVNGLIKPLSLVRLEDIYKKIKDRACNYFDEIQSSLLKRKAAIVSGGEAQYLSLLIAIMADYPVILADEPTANLDADNRRNVIRLLRVLSKDKILVVVSHDNDLISVADKKIIIQNKKIVENDKR